MKKLFMMMMACVLLAACKSPVAQQVQMLQTDVPERPAWASWAWACAAPTP